MEELPQLKVVAPIRTRHPKHNNHAVPRNIPIVSRRSPPADFSVTRSATEGYLNMIEEGHLLGNGPQAQKSVLLF